MRTTRTAAVVAAAAVALLATAGSAAAEPGSPTPSATSKAPKAHKTPKAPKGDGAKALCKRVPRIDARIDRALKRLNGPATERGSIARLQARVNNAHTKGDTAVESFLNDRLTFRKSLLPTLNQRSTDLDAVRSWCGTQGATTGGTGGTAGTGNGTGSAS